MFSGVHGVSHTTKRKWFLHGNQSSSAAPKRTYKADEAQQNISQKKYKKEEEKINENLLESARVSNSSHLSIVKVHILALSPLAWTWTTTHVPLSIGKVFSPFLSFNSSVIHVNIETPPPPSLSELFRPNDLSVRIVQYFPFLSFFLLSLVGSKWDCGANTLHDLRNDTFLAEMDIKGASRSGSIAPHLLDLFNEDGCSYRPIQCSFGISHRNVFSLFQFRN